MKRLFSILLAAVAATVFMTGPLQASQPKMAIFTLRPMTFDAIGYDGEILYALITAVESKNAVKLMPRREMESKLYDAGLAQGDDPGLALTAGKKLGLDYIVFGQVAKVSSGVQAKINLLSIRKKSIVGKWSPTFSGSQAILAGAEKISNDIVSITQGAKQSSSFAAPGSGASPGKSAPAYDISGFKAANSGESVSLIWNFKRSDPILKFNVYRASGTSGPFRYIGTTNKNIFSDNKITIGAEYSYQLGLVLKDGSEHRSKQTALIKSAGEKTPNPPLVLAGYAGVGRASIKFVPSLQNTKDGFDIEKYIVYRKDDSSPEWKSILEVSPKQRSGSNFEFNISDPNVLADGIEYSYAVSSVDDDGKESGLSDLVTITTIPIPLLRASSDNLLRKAELEWGALENVNGYYLYRTSGSNDWHKVASIKAGQSSYVDETGLTDGRSYSYRLTAFDRKGETRPSQEVGIVTKPLPVPPVGLSAVSGLVKSVSLAWTPLTDSDVGGYVIYRGLSNSDMSEIGKVRGYQTGTYLDEGSVFEELNDGTTYYYAVAAYNLFNARGRLTPYTTATTKPRPQSVAGFTAAHVGVGIKLTWAPNAEKDIVTYRIERESSGFWSTIAEVQSSTLSFRDADISPDSTYRYRITAVDKDGLKSDRAVSNAVVIPPAK